MNITDSLVTAEDMKTGEHLKGLVNNNTTYTNINTVKETQINIDWYNTLLDIPDLQEFDDEHLELIKDETRPLYRFDFKDKSYITIDLCHGTTNYFDNCVWHNENNTKEITFECSYCIDTEMEFTVHNTTYICNLTVN